jgi:AsmA protein
MSMRRAAILAGVLALSAIAAGSAPWPVAPAWVADRLNTAFGQARPLSWSAPQAATFSVLPWPSLQIVDARLDNVSGANLVSAPEARIDLSLIALVLGRVAPARLTLTAPTITFDLDRPPFVGRLGAADAIAAITRFAPLGDVSLTNGVVRVTSRKRALDTVIEGVRGRFDILSPATRIRVDMSAVWRDAPFVLSGSLDDPQQAAQGRPSALVVGLASWLGDLTFTGAVTAGAAPGVAGDVSVSSHALGDLLGLFGGTPPPFPGAADVAISGKIKATPEEVVFEEATVTGGGQTLQGVLRLASSGGRLAVSGSLDAEHLALAPLLGPPPPLLETDGNWSRKNFSLVPPRDFDLDLRLSASHVDAYGANLDNVAAAALLKDGVLTAELVDATAYGGRLAGALRLACDPSDLRMAAHGKLAGADVGAAASDLKWPELTGNGDAEFALETIGRSSADLIAGLSGKASFTLTDGAISAVNFEQALRRSQRGPVDLLKDRRSGGTAFSQATLNLLIGQGVAHIVNGALVASSLRADLQGAIDLAGQSWRLRLNASQEGPTGIPPPDAAHLSLDIEGPWSKPNVQTPVEGDNPQPTLVQPSPTTTP